MIRRYTVTVAGKQRTVEVDGVQEGALCVRVDGGKHNLEVRSAPGGGFTLFEGTAVLHAVVDGRAPKLMVGMRGSVVAVEIADARSAALAVLVRHAPTSIGLVRLRAPIPGRISKVLAKPGDKVVAGCGVVVVEAMKMENEIRAPRDGVIKEIKCAEGQTVDANQELVILE